MKWPRHAAAVADETRPDPESRAVSLSLVDDALRVAAGRQFFTRDEALGLLRQIESEARDHDAATTVERIVADLDSSSVDEVMIPRADLLDPLLDIRLVLH